MLTGRVVTGYGEGKRLGFPTANLEVFMGERPAPGIYFVLVKIDNGLDRPGLLVSGVHWEAKKIPRIEAYLLDFKGKLYGHQLAITVKKKLRNLITTNDQKQLVERIKRDIEAARDYFKSGYKG